MKLVNVKFAFSTILQWILVIGTSEIQASLNMARQIQLVY